MNAQSSSLISQLEAASVHAALISQQKELTARQNEYRLAMARAAQQKVKDKTQLSSMESVLLDRIPVGKDKAISYSSIKTLMSDTSVPTGSLASMLCTLVKKEQIIRIGEIRFYRYYKESA